MSTEITGQFRDTAHRVAMELDAAERGVVVTLHYSPDQGYMYVMWTLAAGKLTKHYLSCLETSAERLLAHVQGFINNIDPRP